MDAKHILIAWAGDTDFADAAEKGSDTDRALMAKTLENNRKTRDAWAKQFARGADQSPTAAIVADRAFGRAVLLSSRGREANEVLRRRLEGSARRRMTITGRIARYCRIEQNVS